MSVVRERKRVGIVGGGAAGVTTAFHLAGNPDIEISLIDQTGTFGPGIPYATPDPEHRLNVAADRMGAVASDPGDFLDWLQESGRTVDGNDFVARGMFGEYLVDLLRRAEARAAESGQAIERVTAEATSVDLGHRGVDLTVEDPDGRRVLAFDHVVIATGPLPAGDPVEIPTDLRENGTYVRNAWEMGPESRSAGEGDTLIIGCGLTMIDSAISIAGGAEPGRVIAVSRTGMIPVSHRADYVTVDPPTLSPDGPVDLSTAVGLFTETVDRARAMGGDWRDAMDAMRPVTPEIWRRMPLADKRWFLRHLQRVWESHRFRMAPEVAARFAELERSGLIEVRAGQIAGIAPTGSGARVTIAGNGGARTIDACRIINCTGASGDVTSSAPPLIRGLIDSGLACPDPLRLGLDVSRDGRAIDRQGLESDRISLIGSIRRGAEWESIGITEIRAQAATIAERLTRTASFAPG